MMGVNTGKYRGVDVVGRTITVDGYVMLSGQTEHPLARSGDLLEHRKVLFDKLGPGEHPCHWCQKSLVWGGVSGICADHLNDDRQDNDPDNLVPSCVHCNGKRGRQARDRNPRYITGTPENREFNREKSARYRARKK